MDSYGLSGLARQQIQCSLISVAVMDKPEKYIEKNHIFPLWAPPDKISVLLVATMRSHNLGSKTQKSSDVPGKC